MVKRIRTYNGEGKLVENLKVSGSWCAISEGCSCDSLDGKLSGFFADNGVETVDRIGGVIDDSTAAVGFDEAVSALNVVAVSGLFLLFIVTGQRVLNVVGVTVLRIRVEIGINGFGDGESWGEFCNGCRCVGERSGSEFGDGRRCVCNWSGCYWSRIGERCCGRCVRDRQTGESGIRDCDGRQNYEKLLTTTTKKGEFN